LYFRNDFFAAIVVGGRDESELNNPLARKQMCREAMALGKKDSIKRCVLCTDEEQRQCYVAVCAMSLI
jgi:hypothetical protein